MMVFVVSGLWHGASMTFVVWGALHGFYQIVGYLSTPFRDGLYKNLGLSRERGLGRVLSTAICTVLVCFAWIFFRARDITQAKYIIGRILSPSLFAFPGEFIPGMSAANNLVLAVSLLVLFLVGLYEEKGNGRSLLDGIEKQCLALRWTVYLNLIFTVLIFGVYGAAYNATSFLYFQF